MDLHLSFMLNIIYLFLIPPHLQLIIEKEAKQKTKHKKTYHSDL